MRKLFAFAAAFAAAVFCGCYGVLFLCPLAVIIACVPRENRPARAALAAAGLAAGLLWGWAYDELVVAKADALAGGTHRLEATVIDWPRQTAYGISVPIQAQGLGILLYADLEYETLTPGDGISVIAACRRSDFIKGEISDYYPAKGIFLTAKAYGEMTVTAPDRVPVRYFPHAAAKALRESIKTVFPADTAAFLVGLITGDKTGLSDSVISDLQRTGTAHVVAVSGLHISFLAGLLTLLIGRRRRLGAAVIIPLVFLFAAVTGNSPSALRAALLCCSVLLAPLLGRESDPPTSLAAALMMLLILNPYAAADIGLQLSFASFAGINLISQPLIEKWAKRLRLGELWKQIKKTGSTHRISARIESMLRSAVGRAARGGISIVAVSLGAILFTTPLTAYYFGAVSLIAPIANLLTLWAVSLAFAGGLIIALAGLLAPGAGAVLGFVFAAVPRYFLRVISLLARFPYAAIPMESFYYRAWLWFAYGIVCLFLLLPGERKKPLPALGACMLTLLAAALFTRAAFLGGDLTVSVLDVGQGQSVLLISGDRTALIDCGGNKQENAGDIAADYLQSVGERKLDVLILTHYHSDHTNGVLELLERLEVGTLLVPDVEPESELRELILTGASKQATAVTYITNAYSFSMGDATFTVYPPMGEDDVNEECLSILASAGSFDVLMTGDMGVSSEEQLVERGALPDIELLVVGHHGSKYSTSETLLDAVKPETAVISVGYNSYGHPTEETLGRLEENKIQIYRTDTVGTVTVKVREGSE